MPCTIVIGDGDLIGLHGGGPHMVLDNKRQSEASKQRKCLYHMSELCA